MENNKVKKTTSGKLIALICLVLLVAIVAFAMLNSSRAKEKSQLSLVGEIAILQGGVETARITPQLIQEFEAETFTATQKSSGKKAVDRTFTGLPLIKLLAAKDLPPQGSETILLRSVDGYSVTLSTPEVADSDNVWLVWEADGELLDSSAGPYMVVIRKDPFSQRWSKMLCEIEIDPA